MKENNNIQFFYCPLCDDFYQERGICFSNLNAYLTSNLVNNIGNCPNGHNRKIEKEYAVFLTKKPEKHSNSSILCFDCEKFSKIKDAIKFNIQSILQVAYIQINNIFSKNLIFKGTGDGFLIAFPSMEVGKTIEFCTYLIRDYLNYLPYIKYRIGISFGTFFSYIAMNTIDLFGNEVINVCRIADFGNNNTILLSKSARENLLLNEKYKNNIEEIGNCIDKHRKPYKVFNYLDNDIGSNYFT